VSLNPDSVFPTIAPPRGDRELGVTELQALIAEQHAAGLPAHNTIMELHKKFSFPIACLVFAVLGVSLGASHRKDGKMASFVLGTGVIFVYYVIMFTAIALTKGGWLPSWLSMWLPNIFLGAAGVVLLVTRSRSADQPIAIWLPSWWARKTAAATASEGHTASPPSTGRRPILVLRIPQFELPRPNLLDLYVGKQYLRILGMTMVGLLGLFYISTFLDLSDKLFKGQTTVGQLLAFLAWSTPQFLAYVIAISVLLSALVTSSVCNGCSKRENSMLVRKLW